MTNSNGPISNEKPPIGSPSPEPENQPKATRPRKNSDEIVRSGSHRAKLLEILKTNTGEVLPLHELLIAVYGEAHKELRGPLMMVMKGLKKAMAAEMSEYHILKSRQNKENHFGLYRKDQAS